MITFPVNGKIPAIKGWQDLEESVPHEEGANFGIQTGRRSGVFVVDFDSVQAYESAASRYPETSAVATGRGVHLYYKWPGFWVKTSRGELAPEIDVRGDGGYVVGPGSLHENTGLRYEVLDNRDPVDAPEWLLVWLRKATLQSRECRSTASDNAPTPCEGEKLSAREALARAYLKTAEPSVQGQDGSRKLLNVAMRLVRTWELPLELAYELVEELFNPRCSPPWSEREIWHKLEDARDRCTTPTGTEIERNEQDKAKLLTAARPAVPGHLVNRTDGDDITNAPVEDDELSKLSISKLTYELSHSEEWKGCIRRSVLDDKIYIQEHPFAHKLDAERGAGRLSDSDACSIQAWLESQGHIKGRAGRQDIMTVVDTISKTSTFNPIVEYFQRLPAPSTQHLDTLAFVLFGDDRPMAQRFLRKHLIGSARRMTSPGCQKDETLVMSGPRGGEGKSTLVARLYELPGCPRISRSGMTDISKLQEVGQDLRSMGAVEIAELADLFRFSGGLELAKAFLTRQFDQYTQKYKPDNTEQARTCVFWASTNLQQFIPRGDTATYRRFMPVHVNKDIDIQYIILHRDEIWAEAWAAAQTDEKHYIEKAEQAAFYEAIEPFLEEDGLEYIIERWLRSSNKTNGTLLTWYDIFIGCHPDSDKVPTTRHQKQIAQAMKALGHQCNLRKLGSRGYMASYKLAGLHDAALRN